MGESEVRPDRRATFQRKLTRMLSSLSGNDIIDTSQPPPMLKLYVKVGYYDRNVMRNAFSLAVKGEKRWVTERTEVWEEVDQRVYVRSLARALAQQVGQGGVLRKDDSGDRLDSEVSLMKNGITGSGAATLRFDVTARRGRTDSTPNVPRKARCGAADTSLAEESTSRISV